MKCQRTSLISSTEWLYTSSFMDLVLNHSFDLHKHQNGGQFTPHCHLIPPPNIRCHDCTQILRVEGTKLSERRNDQKKALCRIICTFLAFNFFWMGLISCLWREPIKNMMLLKPKTQCRCFNMCLRFDTGNECGLIIMILYFNTRQIVVTHSNVSYKHKPNWQF